MKIYWAFGLNCHVCERFERKFTHHMEDVFRGLPDVHWIPVSTDSSPINNDLKVREVDGDTVHGYKDLMWNGKLLNKIFKNMEYETPGMALESVDGEMDRFLPGEFVESPWEQHANVDGEPLHREVSYAQEVFDPESVARKFMERIFIFYVYNDLNHKNISPRIKEGLVQRVSEHIESSDDFTLIPERNGKFDAGQWTHAFVRARNL